MLKSTFLSLRFRLVAAASLVLLVMLWVLVANSVRLLDEALVSRENRHLAELQILHNASLAVPLVERDYVKLTRLVSQLGQQKGIRYVVLKDDAQRVVAAEGWEPVRPLPTPQDDFSQLPREAGRFDGMTVLHLGERVVGSVHFGIDTQFLQQAGYQLLWQSLALGWVAFLLTVALLSVIGYWLTRNLRALQRGVGALESGESTVRLPVGSNDEVGALTRAFNRMSQVLDERVEALKKSEARFHAIADFTYGVEAWFNPHGRLIWINRSVERVTGYTPLECLLSSNLVDMLVFDKDRKTTLEVALKALRGSTGDNFEVRMKRKDGSLVWTVINWQPINGPAGEYLGLRVSADEIQARKQAEMKLLDNVVELRRAQPCLCRRRVRLGDLERRHRLVELALADEVLLEQRHDAVALAAGLGQFRALDTELGLGTLDGGAVAVGVDEEEHLALAHRLAFLVAALEEDAAHQGAHLDLARADGAARVGEVERQVALLDRHDHDLRRRRRRRLAPALAATGEQHGAHSCNNGDSCRPPTTYVHAVTPFRWRQARWPDPWSGDVAGACKRESRVL